MDNDGIYHSYIVFTVYIEVAAIDLGCAGCLTGPHCQPKKHNLNGMHGCTQQCLCQGDARSKRGFTVHPPPGMAYLEYNF